MVIPRHELGFIAHGPPGQGAPVGGTGDGLVERVERRLARDDPGLVSLMDALNDQFPHDQDDADGRDDAAARHSRRRKAAVAFLIIALAGLILTAVLTWPPADDTPRPPKSLASASSVHTRRSCPGHEGDCQ